MDDKVLGFEYYGEKFYQVNDVVQELGKLPHSSAPTGRKRKFSYGGIIPWVNERMGLEPTRRGLYMLYSRLKEADEALAARHSARKSLAEEGRLVKLTTIGGLTLISLEDYARYQGMTISNLYKLYYAKDSVIAPFFTKFPGGYTLTEAQFKELVDIIRAESAGPRPKKHRRSSSKRRGAPLNTDITSKARKIDIPDISLQGAD